MKKSFLFLSMLLCSMLFAGHAWAADYNLKVQGIQVSDANKADILGYGTAVYNPSSNTLTLTNAKITANNGYGIYNDIPGLTIQLVGNNTINSHSTGIYTNANCTIKGSGSLKVTVSDVGSGIVAFRCDLTIDNTTIETVGPKSGISGNSYDPSKTLTIKNSAVKAIGTANSSIVNFKELKLVDCKIVSPEGVVYDTTDKVLVDKNKNVIIGKTVIEPATIKQYDLKVAGVQVTPSNAHNITGTGISGRISYSHATRTLTLNNASINIAIGAGSIMGIDNSMEGIKIKLVGKNTINTYYSAIKSTGDMTITGVGTLEVNSDFVCIFVKECTLTIDGAAIGANSGYGCISGDRDYSQLILKKATVSAVGDGSKGLINDFKEIKMEGCSAIKPSGAKITNGAFFGLDGRQVSKELLIAPSAYGIRVAGVRVTPYNADNITGTGISGKVSYSPTTRTLTLENANISYDKYALEILGEELCVQLLGKNTITSTGSYAISVDGYHYGLTITGSGSANIMANYYAIFMNKANLMIDNTTITATGESGIIGNTKAERLTIKKSTVRATGNKRGSIGNFDYIELHGCSITKPSGAYIDYEDIYADGDVKLNGELVRGMTVVIEPNSGAGVRNALSENVKIRMQNRQLTVENSARESIAVYNVMGQIIATRHNPGETETFILPAAGVYIVKVGKGVTKIIAW